MKVINMLMVPIVSLMIGCGSSANDEELNIESINTMQESLVVEASSPEHETLPREISTNKRSTLNGDEGYKNGN